MCRCSDPVFSALGEGIYSYGGFQVALDWSRLSPFVTNYLVPSYNCFAFFPWAAFVGVS